jgi:Ni,Fe-hydrogenase III small subunit
MLSEFKILFHQGKQYIPDVTKAEVPGIFRGRPVISKFDVDEFKLISVCPTNAILANPVRIDLGRCVFCGECARVFPEKIQFSKDYKISSNVRENLIIIEGEDKPVQFDESRIRKDIRRLFRNSLKLRQVSAGGDNSCEWELNASGNVNFDVGRFGIEFVASPRHADGVVVTGPISSNMAEALDICYHATPDPKIIILVGTDAISGGIFEDSEAVNRSFVAKYPVDLYIAGNPSHPLTFINGVLQYLGRVR